MIEDLRAMTLYVRTVELGSFRSCADSFNLSPSVVSHHISQLEKKYGIALLYRSTRKLSQTHEGKAFYSFASQMVAAAGNALNVLNGESVTPHGKLTISLPAGLAASDFMKKISEFIKHYPQVSISLILTDTQVDLIADGVDIALRTGDLKNSSLKTKNIGFVRRLLVCTPEYYGNKSPPMHPLDLSSWDWIRLKMLLSQRTFHHKTKDMCDVPYISRIEVDSVEAMYQLTKNGLGLSSPPDFMVKDDLAKGNLVEVLPDWCIDDVKVSAVWPANVAKESLTIRFLNYMCSL
jgi:DNA-binding transcriptional LysR family regulator